jgi:hypothetical protein
VPEHPQFIKDKPCRSFVPIRIGPIIRRVEFAPLVDQAIRGLKLCGQNVACLKDGTSF